MVQRNRTDLLGDERQADLGERQPLAEPAHLFLFDGAPGAHEATRLVERERVVAGEVDTRKRGVGDLKIRARPTVGWYVPGRPSRVPQRRVDHPGR